MTEPLIEKLKEFITHGEARIIIKDKKIVCAYYRIGEKENKITLEDLKDDRLSLK